jgi:hypothetical protein
MQEAEHSLTQMAMSSGRDTGDETLLVKFYYESVQNEAKTEEAGRPIYEDIEMISIIPPGAKSGVSKPARQREKDRFPEHYRRFKERMSQDHVEGTKLTEWPGVTKAQADELAFFNIKTVEQLAACSDSQTMNMMGLPTLKQKAGKYLEASKEVAATVALENAMEQIAELQKVVEEMKRETPKPKRKRRTKAEMAEHAEATNSE